jgi:peptidoglycan biosynthesis protein MviN/MurJ (putative lipid II flippase)
MKAADGPGSPARPSDGRVVKRTRQERSSPALERRSHAYARSAGAPAIATLTSRISAVAPRSGLARHVRAGNEMDAFTVAFRIPNLVRDLFAEGAMSAAFVPAFTRHVMLRASPPRGGWATTSDHALVIATGLLVVIGMIVCAPSSRALSRVTMRWFPGSSSSPSI